MNIQECMSQGLTKIRLPWWEESSYVELQRTPKGEYGIACTFKSTFVDIYLTRPCLEGYEQWEEYASNSN